MARRSVDTPASAGPEICGWVHMVVRMWIDPCSGDLQSRLRARLEELIASAGLNRSQAAYVVGCSPSRLGEYLTGRVVPSALVLICLEYTVEQASKRRWMRAADVVDAVADHADSDPIWAMRLLVQGRDQCLELSTQARRAIWASGAPSKRLTGPWKTMTYAVLREAAADGRPTPQWLVAPTPLRELWAPLPVRRDRPLHAGLARLGIEVNERELFTA